MSLRLIYDIGMHRGEDTAYYLKRGFRVIGIEADPALAADCRSVFGDAIAQERLVIREGAIAEGPAPRVVFYRNPEISYWGTVNLAWVERNQARGTHHEPVQVERIDLRACLEQYGVPYFMKIDVEGADMLCLRALQGSAVMPAYVSMESDIKSFARLQEEIHLLEQLGYNAFRAVQQSNLPARTRDLPLPGHITHAFEYGCSGPLPEEFPSAWQDAREIRNTYRKIFLLYRHLGTDSWLWRTSFGRKWIQGLGKLVQGEVPGWYDTHARHASFAQAAPGDA